MIRKCKLEDVLPKMLIILLVVLSLMCLLCLFNGQFIDHPVVTLNEPNSKIRGHILKSYNGKDYYAFQDIPYAEAPVGDNRYAEPIPRSGWPGILDTTSNKRTCPQLQLKTTKFAENITEDCLVLNVYLPTNRKSSERVPVLFYIHGGGLLVGDGSYAKFNPGLLVEQELVVVTINYRVGPLGFLTTEDGVIPGNLGLKDQLLALQWVNKNIDCFGGDPQKVTIVGQSAGSTSVSLQVMSKKAKGLFRAAIFESGTSISRGLFVDKARNYSFQLGRILDNTFTFNDSKELLKILRRASINDILLASDKVIKVERNVGVLTDVTWGAVVEPKNYTNALINEPMHQALKNGNFTKVPILLGYTSQEAISMVRTLDTVIKAAVELDSSPANLIHEKLNIPPENRSAAGEKLKKLYTNNSFFKDVEATISFSSESSFINSIIHTADLISKHVPAYLFQFSFVGSAHHQYADMPTIVEAGHGEDISYIWLRIAKYNKEDRLTTDRLLSMWTNFIKHLNPTPTADSQLGIPIWPSLKPNELVYMDIDKNITIKKDPKQYVYVREIYEQYLRPPYNVY